MRSEVRCANCRKTEWTDSGKVVFIPREGADFGGRWIHGADCGDDEVPVDELLQLQKQADWERALTEYRQLREEIGRLEETGDCSCDANEFHTCSLCAKTATLDQRARSLMNLWGDTWAMRLTAAITDTPGVKSSSQGPAREETPPISTNCICKGFLQDPNCSAHYEIVTQTTADAGAKSVVAAPQPHGLHSRLLACGCYPCDFHQAELESRLAGAAALPSADQAAKIVIEEINSSTGPTGGWLDSPKAVCAEIVARLHGANKRELPSPPVPSKEPK